MNNPLSDENAFNDESNRHRAVLESRGYAVEKQEHLDDFLLRNSPWKTYWSGTHERHGQFFAKVNYGYSEEMNRWMGEKEAGLPGHFAQWFDRDEGVLLPQVLETWTSEGNAFVVFKKEMMDKRSGFDILLDSDLKHTLAGLLQRWETISPPGWWSQAHETHDFALNERYGDGVQELSPFGFDLDDNLAVGESGKLLLYDFEFIQWSGRGLQSLYMVQKHATESRKLLLELVRRVGVLALVLSNLRGHVGRPTVRQALSVHREKMRRNGELDLRRRVLSTLVRRLIEKRLAV